MTKAHRQTRKMSLMTLQIIEDEINKLPPSERELVLHNLWRKGLIAKPEGMTPHEFQQIEKNIGILGDGEVGQ